MFGPMAGQLESTLGALDERRLLNGIYLVRMSIAIALAIAATVVRSAFAPVSPVSVLVAIVAVPVAWTAGSLTSS